MRLMLAIRTCGCGGSGSAARSGLARNRGIRHSLGDVVLFTDDDCLPEPGWIEAMVRAIGQDAGIVGVEGLTYTRLREVSPFVHFTAGSSGGYPTCNVGYRAGALRAAGGFDWAAFPAANKEDVDLAYRMMRLGTVIAAPSARVFHPARSISFRHQMERMRRLVSDEVHDVAVAARIAAVCRGRDSGRRALARWTRGDHLVQPESYSWAGPDRSLGSLAPSTTSVRKNIDTAGGEVLVRSAVCPRSAVSCLETPQPWSACPTRFRRPGVKSWWDG